MNLAVDAVHWLLLWKEMERAKTELNSTEKHKGEKVWKMYYNKQWGIKKNKQTKKLLGGFQLQTCRAGSRPFKWVCLPLSQSRDKECIGFWVFSPDDNMRSARFRCSPIGGTPLQGALLEQSALHTCCHVTFIHTPREPNHDWIYLPGMDSLLWLCCTATTTVCSDRLQPQ